MIPRSDIKVKTSPAVVNLVSTMLDSQGMDTKTNHGVAKLYHVLLQTGKHNTPRYIYSDDPPSDELDFKKKIHPVMEEVVRKRFIDHLDNLHEPDDIVKHLSKISNVASRYRKDFQSEMSMDIHRKDYDDTLGVGNGVEEPKTILTTFPKEEQETVRKAVVRLMNHPKFDAGSYGKQLSNLHHLTGYRSTDSYKKRPAADVFTHLISHPEVRSKLLDDLDKSETKSEGHRILAAAIRGHMAKTYMKTGPEMTRFIKKLADDPRSIDKGLYGYSRMHYAPPEQEWVLQSHEEQNDPNKHVSKNTSAINVSTNMEYAFGDLGISNPYLHTKDEILDHAVNADHIIYNHPTFIANRKDQNRYQTHQYYTTAADRVNETNLKTLGIKIRSIPNKEPYRGSMHDVGLEALRQHRSMKDLTKRI